MVHPLQKQLFGNGRGLAPAIETARADPEIPPVRAFGGTKPDHSPQPSEIGAREPAPAAQGLACVTLASFTRPAHLRASPWLAHAPFAFWLVAACRPRLLVELGPEDGFAYLTFAQALQEGGVDGACAAICPEEGGAGQAEPRVGGYPFAEVRRGDLAAAAARFSPGTVDLLHIRAPLPPAELQRCLTAWLPRLAASGILLLYGVALTEGPCGAAALWPRLAARYPAFAFHHGGGLGVIAAGTTLPPALAPLLTASPRQAEIAAVYARLGEAVASDQLLPEAQADAARLHAASPAGAAQAERLRSEWATAILAQQNLQARLDAIEHSSIWRATRPLREGLGTLPRRARARLRRGLGGLRTALRLQPPPPAARQLVFLPAPHPDDARTADANGRYTLAAGGGYTYVPPQPPAPRALGGPLFSIVVPVFNTPAALLGRMLASVRAQWYENWELILADDGSSLAETQQALAAIEMPGTRITRLAQNGGIAAATNAAIALARGDFVVFLDHDDELTADCLHELSCAIAAEDADYLYSDEDKIDARGRFREPFFKPDWSPDALMSTMYTCHVSCVRRSLLAQVGALRSEYDGAQDWDLILRVTERARRITHIPKVLYHWRAAPESMASDLAAKPHAIAAGRRAREAALARRGLQARLEPVAEAPAYARVDYAPSADALVSVIIPSRDNGRVLRQCLESLERVSSWPNFEVIILDNGSVEPQTLQILEELEARGARIIRHAAPFNWSELNNLGARAAQGNLLLFLNDDTELLAHDGLKRMAGYAQLPHIGAVGAKLLYPETLQVQHAGILNLESGPQHAFLRRPADAPGAFMRNLLEFNWSAVTGACMMIERRKFASLGGFDESLAVAYNDVEMGFRLLAQGLFNVVCPAALWLHHESMTRGRDDEDAKKLARLKVEKQNLFLRHPGMLMRDPFHNPNLLPDDPDFEPAA